MAPQTDYATILRETITECPNCDIPLIGSECVDGLHLECVACGFWATEDWVRRIAEKLGRES